MQLLALKSSNSILFLYLKVLKEIFTLMISLCDLHNIRISELVLILGSDIWNSQLSSNTALRIVNFLKNNNWKMGLKRCLMSFLWNMPRSRRIYLKKVKFSMTESQSTARQILTLVLHCKTDGYSPVLHS